MVGMNSTITKNLPGWSTVVGLNRITGVNTRGMKKAGMTDDEIKNLIEGCVQS